MAALNNQQVHSGTYLGRYGAASPKCVSLTGWKAALHPACKWGVHPSRMGDAALPDGNAHTAWMRGVHQGRMACAVLPDGGTHTACKRVSLPGRNGASLPGWNSQLVQPERRLRFTRRLQSGFSLYIPGVRACFCPCKNLTPAGWLLRHLWKQAQDEYLRQ